MLKVLFPQTLPEHFRGTEFGRGAGERKDTTGFSQQSKAAVRAGNAGVVGGEGNKPQVLT